MSLENLLSNAVTAMRKEKFDSSDQLSLGEIISKCEEIQKKGHKTSNGEEPNVSYDFEYLYPDTIDSWRGVYAELALNFSSGGKPLSLSKFIELLKSALGTSFEGYKGGDFTMSRHTPVWVANYGNAGNTALIDVLDRNYESYDRLRWF